MAHHRKRQRLSDGGVAIPSASVLPGNESVTTQNEPQQSPKKSQSRRSLFIRGLAPETTTDDLTNLFSQSYPIKHATAVVEPATQQCKGFGFVTFADAEDAERAKTEFKSHVLHGKKIGIDIAEPRQRKEGEPKAARGDRKPKPASDTTEQAPRLIVRNLPWTIKTEEQLEKYFKPYGGVKQVILPKKPGVGGLLRGFGIVIMKKRNTAENAIKGLSGKEVDGRTLAVDWAVDKTTWQSLQQTNGGASGSGQEDEDDVDDTGLDPDDNSDDSEAEEERFDEVDAANGSDAEEGEDEEEEREGQEVEPPSTTLFIRNLPFSTSDQSLKDHFSQFGSVRYARIVIDHNLGIPKGTGFVSFYEEADALTCLKSAPKQAPASGTRAAGQFSVLQNVEDDPTGQYTMDGRVLQVSQAVSHRDAKRLQVEGTTDRFARDKDKRRLFLLNEGTISTKSPLYKKLSPTDIAMRESSVKQRRTLLQTNPSLHLSLTRLSVRNIPRNIGSSELKALARQAIVGFATDVKAGTRQALSKEELARGGEEMKQAELERKKKAKGVVKQAKVVFEGREGGKVEEKTGAGRSRGYGFIELHTHRNALMALRWLNGHEVGYTVTDPKSGKRPEMQDRKKRLIVEFAIENAQVVHRRKEREEKFKDGGKDTPEESDKISEPAEQVEKKKKSSKRKRDDDSHEDPKEKKALAGKKGLIAKKRSEKRFLRKQGKL